MPATEKSPAGWTTARVKIVKGEFYFICYEHEPPAGQKEVIMEAHQLRRVRALFSSLPKVCVPFTRLTLGRRSVYSTHFVRFLYPKMQLFRIIKFLRFCGKSGVDG